MAGAAFYDFDGTIIRKNLVHALWYVARHNRGHWKSALRSAATLAGIPFFAATNWYDRQVFNEIFFRWYKGEHQDRLRYLSEELFQKVLLPSIRPAMGDLIRSSRRSGLRQVLITGAPEFAVLPVIRHFAFDDFAANRLEFKRDVATGRLVPPVMAAATKAAWIRTYCEREGIPLSSCYGYADSISDLPMLAMVGHPAAVNPDAALRRAARRHDWPVLDFD